MQNAGMVEGSDGGLSSQGPDTCCSSVNWLPGSQTHLFFKIRLNVALFPQLRVRGQSPLSQLSPVPLLWVPHTQPASSALYLSCRVLITGFRCTSVYIIISLRDFLPRICRRGTLSVLDSCSVGANRCFAEWVNDKKLFSIRVFKNLVCGRCEVFMPHVIWLM